VRQKTPMIWPMQSSRTKTVALPAQYNGRKGRRPNRKSPEANQNPRKPATRASRIEMRRRFVDSRPCRLTIGVIGAGASPRSLD